MHFKELAKHLRALGHELAICDENRVSNEFRFFSFSLFDMLRAALWSDCIYLRVRPTGSIPGWEPAILMLLRKLLRKPLVWEINAPVYEGVILEEYDENESLRREKLLKKRAGGVDAAFCVSVEITDYAARVLGVANPIYVPNGSNCDDIGPHISKLEGLELPNDGPILFWMGSGILPWEGDRIIVELAEQMLTKGISGTIIVVGNRREGEGALPRNIVHLGRVSHTELPKYLATSDICLALYDVNAFERHGYAFYNSPLKLYEYMAAEKAIIGTNIGEIARTIEHQKDGYLVGFDVAEIVVAVDELVNNKDMRESMGREARKKATDYYNWGRAAKQTADAIRQVMEAYS